MGGRIKCELNRGEVLFTSHARKNYFTVPTIHKKQIFLHLHPELMYPGPPKRTPIHPIWPLSPEKNEIKRIKNLTFMPKIGIITLWSLKVGIDLLSE